jgi:hypothetical protein
MVGVKSYLAIKQLIYLMEKRPDITFFMFELINPPLSGFKRFNFHKNIVSNDIIINSLIDLDAARIYSWVLDEPNEPDEYFIYVYNYTDKDVSASVIQRSWKKYRYNVFKKRRDPLKRELMAYYWHPSKLSFNID